MDLDTILENGDSAVLCRRMPVADDMEFLDAAPN